MKIEILIFSYLGVCFSMIVFNIMCIFVFKRRDKKLLKSSINFYEKIKDQIDNKEVSKRHKKLLRRKLNKVNHLMAFDATLEKMFRSDPEGIKWYLSELDSVFMYLILKYQHKEELLAAYFPYIIKKYGIMKGTQVSIFLEILEDMAANRNIYCRENALEALYSIGNEDSVADALLELDKSGYYHHNKLITDGLLTFTGNKKHLAKILWKRYPTFTTHMKVAILDYFRFFSGEYSDNMLLLLKDETQNDEVRFSCIRYFAKYPCQAAYPVLCELAEKPAKKWEYHAIAATALGFYPSEKTIEILKGLLMSRNWYICYNSAESLERLGLDYDDLIDIFEGKDRLASEILRYRMDHWKMLKKKEAVKCET